MTGYLSGFLTTHPIGMFFPLAPGSGRRHPSQLYEAFFEGTLETIREIMRKAKITRTALILVGPALAEQDFRDSALYDGAHAHILRPKRSA